MFKQDNIKECWQTKTWWTALQVYSARTALAGCKTLADMWSHQDTDQLQRLKNELTLLQDSGVVFPMESWPARLLRSHPRYRRHLTACICL